MIAKTYGTLKGLKVAVKVFESYDEADTAAGKVNAMLDAGNDNLAYRSGPLQDARAIVCDMLEELTGIERKTVDTGRKDKDGNAILTYAESEGKYAEQVCAEKGWEDLSHLQDEFNTRCAMENEGAGLMVDIKERERKPAAPKKLAKGYLNTAAVILAAGNADKALAMIQSLIPGASFTQTRNMEKTHNYQGEVRGKQVNITESYKDCETLGGLLKAYDEAKRRREENERMESLGV